MKSTTTTWVSILANQMGNVGSSGMTISETTAAAPTHQTNAVSATTANRARNSGFRPSMTLRNLPHEPSAGIGDNAATLLDRRL